MILFGIGDFFGQIVWNFAIRSTSVFLPRLEMVDQQAKSFFFYIKIWVENQEKIGGVGRSIGGKGNPTGKRNDTDAAGGSESGNQIGGGGAIQSLVRHSTRFRN